ncbi:MAG: hypothetical protein COV29_03425 [Candidatus Yanofskybacteria bacterium CG10_big_fil_rev_8_21_14_0_10_36_16]|uniref:Uncharacterized protein n=1 Tax=Candidatus Yanofskybacteria bacterium CG10_big_fil_rev_8_21_14_0_10_36_16 TaxID=1975096 RepID=A0A2J0QAP7_9BACT|nr:MAG: hypothetical protein COV29_03425 [Candidatus Yanofskybacteria bacterium CG10_big_fil_rev_8_21_14_0_10_36_16]
MEKFKPERKSATVEVVGGNISDQERIINHQEFNFLNQVRLKNEREKTTEELELIREINERLREFINQYGGQYIEVSADNMHFFTWEDIDTETKSEFLSKRPDFTGFEGKFSPDDQSIYIIHEEKTHKLKFASTLVHELIHFMAFNSLSILKKEDKKLTIGDRRLGFAVKKTKGRAYYFNDINEALTVELELEFKKRYFDKISLTAKLEKERQRLVKEFKSDLNVLDNEKSAIDDSTWIEKISDGRYRYMVNVYNEEVNKLRDLIRDIFENNPDEFNSLGEVFNLFTKAYFTGRLLPIAKLIEKTYGKGSFRELGENTKSKDEESLL